MNYSLFYVPPYKTELKNATMTKRAFDDFQIDQKLLQSITRKTRIDSWKNQEYSTKVDRVRKPAMHRCIEDQTLKEGIFLVFGQT